MTKPRDLATLGGGFTQSGTGAVQRSVESKLKDTVSVKDFGAVGDNVVDDTTAFQNAIAYGCANKVTIYIPDGTYRLTSTLTINTGQETGCALVGMGGAKEPVLKFYGVNLGLLIEGSKSTLLKDIAVDMSSCTGSMVGIYVNAMWFSTFENVVVVGPDGGSAPGATATYGILLRPQVAALATPISILSQATTINSPVGINFGVYWNTFNKLDVAGFNYGIVLAGGEGGSNPRTNQNQFNQCRFNGNYYGIWMEGLGGGNVFISTTAENNNGDSVRVESVSGGTGPIWIGGEMSGGRQWVGPGLLLSPTAGTSIVNANTSGDTATHWRFTDQGAQAYGTKFTGNEFLSDWSSKADVSPISSKTTSSKTATIASVDITAATPISFLITVHFTDSTTPQGGAVLKYRFSGFDPSGAPAIQVSFVQEFSHAYWTNLGGGTVTPTLTGSLSGTTYTISANVGWNSVGTDPGESSLNYTITELFSPGGSTVTLL